MMTILIAVVVVLGIIAFAQLIRVFELTSKLRGTNEYEMSDRENKNLSRWMFVFLLGYFAFFAWLVWKWGGKLLPEAASIHGQEIDTLMDFNLWVITIVFIITHVLLFWFPLRFAGKKGRKADFISHNDKLELIWTGIPSAFLAVLIIYGINTWDDSMMSKPDDSINIELYAKQFDWTARYSGSDNALGDANYRMISSSNPLGLITKEKIEERLVELDAELSKLQGKLAAEVEGSVNYEEIEDKIYLKEKHIRRVKAFKKSENDFTKAYDDKLVKVEFHIPVNKPVSFQIRSQDVIHSAYMPHFRAQMNAVPGAITQFYYTPTITTTEMKEKTGNPDFNFLLYCNKICGSAHYNMKMEIIVESEEEYNKWLAEQPAFYAEGLSSVDSEENVQLAQNIN